MKIKITDFGKRHFDKNFGGTKVLNFSPEKFEEIINENVYVTKIPGYAPFCKLLVIKNFTDARIGSMPITLENYQYLRSGYSSRRESELPVFSRWFELPIGKPKAKYLVLVLYSKEQIDKEGRITEGEHNDPNEKYIPFDADWGVVAILGQSHPNEEPMKPETMLRNALGIEEGGSGVPLDREKYLKSVEFWDKNATVK
jgi:hypothetical protein